MTVNIVILNYNGKHLLLRYLPSVIAASRRSHHECKVSVVDNKSSDGSAEFIKTNYTDVSVYEAKENRVLCSYNEYLKTIADDIVILLNTDIEVDPNFVDPLVSHFINEDILFVAPKELNMSGIYHGNLNRLYHRFGLVSAAPKGDDYNLLQYDITVGAGAFNRLKFLELGGYDDMYLPGIIEDFDLCYRGWKYGWRGVYEPKSFYFHEGGGSFKLKYRRDETDILAQRNTFLFFWKNITSKRLIFMHILALPLLLSAALLRGKLYIIKGFIRALKMRKTAFAKRRTAAIQASISDEEIIRRVNLSYKV